MTQTELKTIDKNNWSISSEWDGLQPQRKKIISPILYTSCFQNTTLRITAKLFADSFAEPILVDAEANIEVDRRETTFAELTSDWRLIPDAK